MQLSIRLQQHGKKNHPYWWIVVAPKYSNVFGRFTQHLGFWSPRHNINIKRQVILNLPRVKYWLMNGAVPTPKIQKFLHMYGMFPKNWHYIKSEEELAKEAAKAKPYEEMTPKQKSLHDRRQKRKARTQLAPFNYHRYESMSMFPNKERQTLMARQHELEFENMVIRDMLHKADFQKYDRLAELGMDKDYGRPFDKLQKVKQKLRTFKSQLTLLEKQYANSKFLQKSKLIQTINSLTKQLSSLQAETNQYSQKWPQRPSSGSSPQSQGEYMTSQSLESTLKYELLTKKFTKTQQQLAKAKTLFEPVTLEEVARKFKEIIKRILSTKTTKSTLRGRWISFENKMLLRNLTDQDIFDFAEKFYENILNNKQGGLLRLHLEVIDGTDQVANRVFEAMIQSRKTNKQPENKSKQTKQQTPLQTSVASEASETSETPASETPEASQQPEKTSQQVVQQPSSQSNPQIKNNKSDKNQRWYNTQAPPSFPNILFQQGNYFPSIRPVHPRPDLKSYIPEEHFDPIDVNKLDILQMDALEPEEQLERYRRKRNPEMSIQERKDQDQKKRMERLKIFMQN